MRKETLTFIFVFFMILTVNSQIVDVESYRLKNDTSKFVGNINASFSANKNQKQIFQVGIKSDLSLKIKRHNIMLITIYSWVNTIDNGKKDDFLNEGFQHLRYNYLLIDRLKLETYLQYQYNKIMSLKERDLVGIGLRYKVINDNKTMIYVGSSIMYEHNVYTSNFKTDYIKSSNYITWNSYLTKYLRIGNTTYFQFNLDNKYRVYSILEAAINIYKRISFRIDFTLKYDNVDNPSLTYSTNNMISVSF